MKITTIFEKHRSKGWPELKLHFQQAKAKGKVLNSAEKLAKYIRKLFDQGTFDTQEEAILLALNHLNQPVFYYRLAKGGKDIVDTDPRLIFQVLICTSTERFVVAHNHPHGLEMASLEDVKSAHALHLMANLFDIEFVDSLVITRRGFYSLAEEGLLWL